MECDWFCSIKRIFDRTIDRADAEDELGEGDEPDNLGPVFDFLATDDS